ncbi:hypothetical protein [Microcoleus asticus]|uniref:hypothetical protein n=1 Tax=Microcoleus asticus TaxID=2815231 RepID=UPI0030D86A7B
MYYQNLELVDFHLGRNLEAIGDLAWAAVGAIAHLQKGRSHFCVSHKNSKRGLTIINLTE